MFATSLIIFLQCFRMSFVAILIMNIFEENKNSTTYIITGMMMGIIGSSFIAFITKSLFISFGGIGDEILNSTLLFCMIISIIMALLVSSNNQNIQNKEVDNKHNFIQNNILLFLIFFITLYAIFIIIVKIYAISSTLLVSDNIYVQGLIIGIILNFIVSYFMHILFKNYLKTIKIYKILLMLICSGFAAQIVGMLSGASIITLLSQNLWDSSQIFSDKMFFGHMLYIIAGYISKPTILQFIIYISTFIIIQIMIITKSSFRLHNNK